MFADYCAPFRLSRFRRTAPPGLKLESVGGCDFVFITHNKSTMELASHLIGVTMGEPGVSRLVAVDVDEAVRMAAVG